MRLIDKDKIHKEAMDIIHDKAGWKAFAIANAISMAETIEAEPVKHGTWEEVEFGQFFECSNCHNSSLCGCENYCPKCGAKMDGGNKDG